MSKQSGLGDQFFFNGIDLSDDVTQLTSISCPRTSSEWTGIRQKAFERVLLLRDGLMSGITQFDPSVAHVAFRGLPRTDVIASYFRGSGIGSPAASMVAKQINYDGTREAAGLFPLAFTAQANQYGLEWGKQLTAGKRTDTTATNGASLDGAAATNFGAQAWVQVFAFTGTSVTIKIQDSADNAAWTDLAAGSFGAITAAGAARIQTARNATVRRYLRVITTGTFSNAIFGVQVSRNKATVNF